MNTVNIDDAYKVVVVTEGVGDVTVVTAPSPAVLIETTGLGPQGPQGPQGPTGPPGSGGLVVNTAATVDKSVVYYDAASSAFRADAIWTTTTISDGGNF